MSPKEAVLVIDDSPLVATLVAEALANQSYEVAIARDGEAGLRSAAGAKFAVAICDLDMPRMTGLEVLRRLHHSQPLLQVIIFTETIDTQVAVEAMKLGAFGYITKSATTQAMVDEVGKALAHRRVLERNRQLEAAALEHHQQLERLLEEKTSQIARLEQARAHEERLVAMGTMVAGVAHEVNNPLAVLKSNARYLAEVLPEGLSAMSPEDRLDTTVAVQEIETCTLRIQRIVESLRRLVRTPQAAAACELEPALEEARLVCRARLPEHLSMRFDVLPQPPKVAVSQDDLVLIVSNLVINAGHAIEASKGQGHVDVRVREAQGRLSLEIEDNGCGIPAQLLSQVCNPFFTTKPPGKGTGLGLSLVHQVVKNAGGEMKIDSVDGAGTCVRIALPVAR